MDTSTMTRSANAFGISGTETTDLEKLLQSLGFASLRAAKEYYDAQEQPAHTYAGMTYTGNATRYDEPR